MPISIPKTNKFLNSREWRTFLNSAHNTASYPGVMTAVKASKAWRASKAWVSGKAARTYGWLLTDDALGAGPGKTLGI